jgi:uncharacterized protein
MPPQAGFARRLSAGARKLDRFQAKLVRTTPCSTHTPCARLAESPAGALLHVLKKEESMFEGQPQAELDAIIQGNNEFKQLYQRHKQLDKQVLDAELGVLAVDDLTLTQMKREKLAAKDRLTRLYDVLHH